MGRSNIDIRYIAVSGTNLGGGEEVFKEINPINAFRFKTIVAGANINLISGADTITISGASGSGTGTITGGTNVGGGNGVFAQVNAANLEFKTLVAGSNTSLTPAANTITIATTPAGSNKQLQYNNSGVLGASSNLIFDPTTGLTTNLLKLSTTPTLGTLADNILIRNTSTGLVDRIATTSIFTLLTANNGLSKVGTNVRLGGALTGNTSITGAFGLNFSNSYIATPVSASVPTYTFVGNLTSGIQMPVANEMLFVTSGNHRMRFFNSNEIRVGGNINSLDYANESKFIIEGSENGPANGIQIASLGFSNDANNVGQTSAEIAKVLVSLQDSTANHGVMEFQTKDGTTLATRMKIDKNGLVSIISTPPTDNTNDLLVWNPITGDIGKTSRAGLGGGGTPAGSNTYVQYNNAGAFGASATFTFAGGILTTPNLTHSSAPVIGTLNDNILIRNTGTGAIERVATTTITNTLTSNNGITKSGNNFRLGGALTGNTTIGAGSTHDLTFQNNSWTFGSRTGATTVNSMTIGLNNSSIGGTGSLAVGQNNRATGQRSVAMGFAAYSLSDISFALGNNVTTSNTYALAGGYGQSSTIPVIAAGLASFNYSYNNGSQTVGHGALAQSSAILGGQNHNIESGNVRAAIIGGNAIKLTGTSYIDHTAVANLAIMSTPAAGIASDDVLVRSSTTGRIRAVTQASLAGSGGTPAGANTYVQYNNAGAFGASATFTFNSGTGLLTSPNLALSTVPTIGTLNDNILTRNTSTGAIERIATSSIGTANNGLTKSGNNYRLGGALTGNTTISGAFGINFTNTYNTFGTRSGTTGTNSLTVGINNLASGSYSIAVGQQSKASNFGAMAVGLLANAQASWSFATGNQTSATADQAAAFGAWTEAGGNSSFAGGGTANISFPKVRAMGAKAFNFSENTISQIDGHGALAGDSAILGGINHNIESGNVRAAIIGGSGIKLTGTSYIDHTAVGNLAIMTAPAAGLSSDSVLVRRGTNGKILAITQASLVSANNGINKIGSNIRLGGALTGDTTISGAFGLNFTNNYVTIGSRSGTTGLNTLTVGFSNLASTSYSMAVGQQSKAQGATSFAAGSFAVASGAQSVAFGYGGTATGMGAFASGFGNGVGKGVISSGIASFNHSFNHNVNQVAGHGALANYSVILGGQNHNIEVGNTGAAIIGGQDIKLTGSSFFNTVAVPALAIISTPPVGSGDNRILVWNGAGSSKKISSSANWYFNSTSNAVTLGTRTGTTGQYNTTIGLNNSATANYGLVVGEQNVVSQSHSIAVGRDNRVTTQYSQAFGSNTVASGSTSYAEGASTHAGGSYSHSQGFATKALGYGSHSGGFGVTISSKPIIARGQGSFNHSVNYTPQTHGNGANAYASVILGGYNHNIDSTADGAAIIGAAGGIASNGINLNSSTYQYHTAVGNLVIWNTPNTGVGADDVLVWNSTDKKVKKVTQASISDERLKTSLQPIESVVEKVSNLSTVEFEYNDKNIQGISGTKDYGLIAQEVEKIFPHVVKDNLTIDGDDTLYKTIEYRKLVPVLFAAIKELNEKIKDLESKIK